MSGIFGLFDPAGPDVEALREAAARVTYRGRPVIHARPPVALGTFVRDGEEAGFIETEHGAFVADARVDATLSGTVAERLARRHSGAALLEAVLAARGPTALAELAADFALARFDAAAETLTLSRDAFGLRPIFWAQRGPRVGFACDPAILISLGLASGELDRERVAAYLALRDFRGERTAFDGIRRALGGRWISFDRGGRIHEGRWFRPEEVSEERATPDEFARALSDSLVAAVTSRTAGRRVCLLLSGGRDSGSVAVALARAGVRATCLTLQFDPELGCSEEEPARALAEALGHQWVACPTPTRAAVADLTALPVFSGSPVGLGPYPQFRALRETALKSGAEVLMDGQGGEPLFSASPVAVLDLVRSGQLGTAARVARAFHNSWTYPYRIQAKAAVRAILPRALVRARERLRPIAPWVRERVAHGLDQVTAPRSARDHLVLALLAAGSSPNGELTERLFQLGGQEYTWPLLDQRVVRLALTLPLTQRVPVPGPKPLLARGLLDGFDRTRRKARFNAYHTQLAASLVRDFPSWWGPCSLGVQAGFVRPDRLWALADPHWTAAVYSLFSVEAWLRREVQ